MMDDWVLEDESGEGKVVSSKDSTVAPVVETTETKDGKLPSSVDSTVTSNEKPTNTFPTIRIPTPRVAKRWCHIYTRKGVCPRRNCPYTHMSSLDEREEALTAISRLFETHPPCLMQGCLNLTSRISYPTNRHKRRFCVRCRRLVHRAKYVLL
jgi:hypothetical protein